MGNTFIRRGLIALALATQAFTSVSQAVNLPAPGVSVDGQAVLYQSKAMFQAQRYINRAELNASGVLNTDDPVAAQNLLDQFVSRSQPVLTVTGAELRPLPVSLPNQLREVSVAFPSGFTLEGIPLKDAAGQTSWSSFELSNMVPDIRSQTVWGDVVVRTGGTLTPYLYTPPSVVAAEWTAIRLMTATGIATGVDLRSTVSKEVPSDPIEFLYTNVLWPSSITTASPTDALWWPEASAWDPNTSVAALRAAGRNGISSGPDEHSAAIWLAGLQLMPEVLPAQTTYGSFLGTDSVGDMLITVSLQPVPEPGTQALLAVGMFGLLWVARRAKG